jgi:hypothetical protein
MAILNRSVRFAPPAGAEVKHLALAGSRNTPLPILSNRSDCDSEPLE